MPMDLIRERELGLCTPPDQFCRALSSSISLYRRLALEDALVCHEGCVNDITFSATGDVLASGSDDTRICFWDVNSRELKSTIATLHSQNIFNVKFLPETGDTKIASCAGDGLVKVHDLVHTATTTFDHHCASVNELEIEPGSPNLILSSSDDCTVQQVDVREPTQSNAKILINLATPILEISSISISKSKPWLLAVGAHDSTLRIYDRRKPAPQSQGHHNSEGAVCAAKFTLSGGQILHRRAISAVCFADNGSEVLVNSFGDYVYLFDIDSQVSKNQFSKNLDSNSWKQSSMDGEAGEARAFCRTSDDARNIQNSGDRTAGSSWMVREAESMHEATIANPNIDSDTLSSAIGSDNQSQSLHQSPNPGSEIQPSNQPHTMENEQQSSVEAFPSNIIRQLQEATSERRDTGDEMEEESDDDSYLAELSPSFVAFLAQVNHGLRGAEVSLALQNWETETDSSFSGDGTGGRVIYDWGATSDTVSRSGSDSELAESNERYDELEEFETWKKLGNILASGCAGKGLHKQPWSRCYRGHLNIRTTKSVSFLGSEQNIVAAGSDDGRMFLWDRETGHVISALRGDRHTVNCIRSHPHDLLLASCGIDSTVKIWTPCLAAPKKRNFKWYKSLAYNEIQRRRGPTPLAYGRGFYRQELLDAYGELQGSGVDSMES